MNAKLVEYGILQEKSDIRAHVAPITKIIFVFKTIEVQNFIKLYGDNIPKCSAKQKNVTGITAIGYIIPWNDIPEIITVTYNKFEWWKCFKQEMSTSRKGDLAVKVVEMLMRDGKFPLWINPKEAKTIQIDINGTDLTIDGKWSVQVKCDFNAGPKDKGGTGNLFLQTYERNPK